MKIKTIENLVQIGFENRVDASRKDEIQALFTEKLAEGVSHFIIDLSAVTFLDSAAIALFVSLLKKAQAVQGNVSLILPVNEEAQFILNATRMDRIFPIVPSAEEALESFHFSL